MALPTFVQLVNKVLTRLREANVNSITDTAYAALLGEFINAEKANAEDAWQWRTNRTTINVSVLADSSTVTYSLTGAGVRFKVLSAWNITLPAAMEFKSQREINDLKGANSLNNITSAQTTYYTFRGVDGNGDTQIEVWPPATAAQTIRFNVYIPQADLVNDSDTLNIPSRPIIEAAYALAIAERGEDGGLPAQVQAARTKDLLSAAIADDMVLTGDDEQQWDQEPR